MHERARIGHAAEEFAAARLVMDGYRILDRNWQCRYGELDIVATRDEAIAIVEVKARRGAGVGVALEAVTPAKLRRLRLLAGLWAAAHPETPGRLRLDAVGVSLAGGKVRAYTHLVGIDGP